jgi:hypothetical protein
MIKVHYFIYTNQENKNFLLTLNAMTLEIIINKNTKKKIISL